MDPVPDPLLLRKCEMTQGGINTNSHRVDVRILGDNCVMLAAEIKEIKPKRQLNHRGAHKTSQLNHSNGPWRAIRNTLSFPIKMKWLVYRPPHVLPPSDGATTTFLIPALKMTFIREQLCPWERARGGTFVALYSVRVLAREAEHTTRAT